MRMSRVSGLGTVAVAGCLFGSAWAADVNGDWIDASAGQIPRSAIRVGHQPNDGALYACRTRHAQGVYVGTIGAGDSGCRIGYAGRMLTLTQYQVLVAPRVIVGGPAIVATPPKVLLNPPAVAVTGAPPAGTAEATRRGFDGEGRPYIEKRLADGTVIRQMPSGQRVTKPDGSTSETRVSPIMAQPPTPPELPADRARGREWMDQHNAALREVISRLVNDDSSEMAKFDASESSNAGNNVFEQIRYRTRIATFLAGDR